MKPTKTTPREHLFTAAAPQQGYFTAGQAIAAGYKNNTHPYHIQTGEWIREYRGIYRLAFFPHSDEGELVCWSLWSRNKAGIIEGVYSHETALSLFELGEVMPSKLHMTVPKKFRRTGPIPPVLALHYDNFAEIDIEKRQGFYVTTPVRTIADLIESDTMTNRQLLAAVSSANKRGLITKSTIRHAGISHALQEKITLMIGGADE